MGRAPEHSIPRILFILQYFYPDVTGFSQMLGDLTMHLSESGRYHCTVLAGSTARSARRPNHLSNHLGKVRIKRIRTLGAGKRTIIHRLIEYSAYYSGVVAYLLSRRNYDLVVCFTTPPLIGFAATVGLSLSHTPLVYYVQDLYPELLYDMRYIRSPWLMRKLSIFNRLILRRATRVATIGRWMAKKLQRDYGLHSSSIPVIENWATGISYVEPPRSREFTILYSGNVGLAHDFSLLPALLSRLNGREHIRFRFVGSGRQYENVRRMFGRHKGLTAEFTGYVDRSELQNVLSSAHLFMVAQAEYTVGDILPSKFYSYLAAGRPLLYLGTRKSEIGETIKKNELGAVVECEADVEPAVDIITSYSGQPPDYLESCRRARRVYDEQMGFERSAAAFESLVAEVLAR